MTTRVRAALLLATVLAVTVLVATACGAPLEQAATAPGPPAEALAANDGFPHQPLWPFSDERQARYWQEEAGPNGHQPWHVDAGFTAVAFAQGFLGFTGIDKVTSTSETADEAWIGVGFVLPEGRDTTAAVVHLARFGAGPDAPWEVVGTRDDTLALDTPRYGSIAASPITAGGTITGVDESLRLQVRQADRDGVLGEHCCVSAGGQAQRWSAEVAYSGPGTAALTLVVSTGGHVADVERFAVTGLQVQGS
jgi:hypothetical protein